MILERWGVIFRALPTLRPHLLRVSRLKTLFRRLIVCLTHIYGSHSTNIHALHDDSPRL